MRPPELWLRHALLTALGCQAWLFVACTDADTRAKDQQPTTEARCAQALALAPRRNTDLSHCDLSGRSFENADFSGTNFDAALLHHVSFRGATLSGARFVRADLVGADFSGADMSDAIMQGVSSAGSTFRDCRMVRVTLDSARLTGTDLTRANLEGASVRDAFWSEVLMTEAVLDGADFTGSKLNTSLAGTWLDTTCPDGTTNPTSSSEFCKAHLIADRVPRRLKSSPK